MYEIPKPELLNPDRVERNDREDLTTEDHRTQSQLLAKALGQSCAYADQLWNQLDALRGYLLDSLPPDPHTWDVHASGPLPTSASPTGPDDEAGWRQWADAFAATTSVLCGAHGDSGFGMSRAREEARMRRSMPVIQAQADAREPDTVTSATPDRVGPAAAQQGDPGRTVNPDGPPDSLRHNIAVYAKAGAGAVVAVLALRGLRPAPRNGRPRRSDAASD